MIWLRRIVIALLVVVVLAYIGAGTYMYVFQRSFQYEPEGKFLALGETLLKTAEQVEIPTSNNERIRGWYAPPTEAGKPVIVYYKGQRMGAARPLDAVANGLRRRKEDQP